MYRYLVLLLLLELCKQYKAKPQSNGYYNKGSDGLYYKFHNENVDWDTAKAKCERESAHLAIIISSATFKYVKSTYSFYMSGIWIGARDMNSSNDWRWTDEDQTPVQSMYWEAGEPNNSRGNKEDCVMINFAKNPGRFHDASCRWMGPKFLCQKEHRSCVKEKGYCVTQNGKDVNTTKLSNVEADKCLEKCLEFPHATGCSIVQGHPVEKEYGCYVTTQNVMRGNGDKKHACWIISKCEGTGPLVPPPPEIPTGYKKGYLGSLYKLYMHEVDWLTAKLKCHEDGGQLAIDDSVTGHELLLQSYTGQKYWIGISDLEQKGVWKFEDGKGMRKTFWDGGRPFHHSKNKGCVLIWDNGRWRDEWCSSPRSFLCEVQGMYVENGHETSHRYTLPMIIVGVVGVLLCIAVPACIFQKRRSRERSESPSLPADAQNQVISNEGVIVGPLRPMRINRGAKAPQPPPRDMYPPNNEPLGELPPPQSYDTMPNDNELEDLHNGVEPIIMYRPTNAEDPKERKKLRIPKPK